ncbi:MAG: sulfotransferase [Planctomycetota bacterium]
MKQAEPGIAILGFPRSGTTLLRRLLDAHSAIDAPGETYLLSSCARFLEHQRVVDGVDAGVLSGVSLLGMDSQKVLEQLRRMVQELRGEHARNVGKSRWVEKTAIDAFHVDGIRRVFSDSLRYVLVVRHALDVCVSTQEWCTRLESYPDELHQYIVRNPQPLVAFAHAWVDVMQSLGKLRQELADRVFVVRYESLVAEPEVVLRGLLDFLDESWEEGMLERALADRKMDGFGDWKVHARGSVDDQSIGRWRRLSQGSLRQLAPIVNPQLEEWEYDPVPTRGVDDPEEALRRYELGILLHAAQRPGPPRALRPADDSLESEVLSKSRSRES